MQSPKNAAARSGEAVLNEIDVQAGLGIPPAPPGLEKEPTFVSEHVRVDKEQNGELARSDVHGHR